VPGPLYRTSEVLLRGDRYKRLTLVQL